MRYEYDPDGFLTNKANLTNPTEKTLYVYSSRGELLKVTLPDSTVVEYVHDPLGRRIAKKVNGAMVEKYLWQGMTRLLTVYDGNDNLLMRFEYADERVPVAVTAEGVTYYLAYDRVGSLRAVADTAGNVVKRIDYDSFGNIIADSNEAFEIFFGFAGGLNDRDTRLVRFGYRDYDPDMGRWTAKDPILFGGGDIDLYRYCSNNPYLFIDPFGTDVYFVGIGLSAFIGKSPDPSSKRGYAVQSSLGIALDTNTWSFKLYKSTGKADPCLDIVGGAGIGIGPIGGILKGDMKDLFGFAREKTTYLAIISLTNIETRNDKYGFAVSFGGKGFGVGYTDIQTYTAPIF